MFPVLGYFSLVLPPLLFLDYILVSLQTLVELSHPYGL